MASNSESCDATLRKKIEALKAEDARLDLELKKLEKMGSTPEENKRLYIKSLHDYNDVKDAAQAVFGALATYEGVTVGELHKKYLPNLKDP